MTRKAIVKPETGEREIGKKTLKQFFFSHLVSKNKRSVEAHARSAHHHQALSISHIVGISTINSNVRTSSVLRFTLLWKFSIVLFV